MTSSGHEFVKPLVNPVALREVFNLLVHSYEIILDLNFQDLVSPARLQWFCESALVIIEVLLGDFLLSIDLSCIKIGFHERV